MTDFHQLYATYAPDVHRFALYLSGDPALADDITSETFLRAWSSSAPIREATVKSYLFTIARHLYLHELRRRGRHEELPEDLPSPAQSQEELSQQSSALAAVFAALRRLPERDRAALLMRAQDEMSYEEIGRALGLSAGAARVKVHRARLKIVSWVPKEVMP